MLGIAIAIVAVTALMAKVSDWIADLLERRRI